MNKNQLVNFSEADGFIKPGYYTMNIFQDKNVGAGIAPLPNLSAIPGSSSIRSERPPTPHIVPTLHHLG